MPTKGMKHTRLGSVCTIRRGYHFSSELLKEMYSDEKTDYRYFSVARVHESWSHAEDVYVKPVDRFDEYRFNKYGITSSTVIMTRNGYSYGVMYLGKVEDDQHCVSSNNTYMLHVDSAKALPEYVRVFLDSEYGRKLVESTYINRSIATIDPHKLMDVKIPLPSLEEQRELVDKVLAKESARDELRAEIPTLFEKELRLK